MKIMVNVVPASGRQSLEEVSSGEYRVFLKKPAVDGKANAELVKFLRRHFGVQVSIVSGARSRKKIIEVDDGHHV